MKIDIWSDIACPFCYIGTKQLKTAIEKFAHGSEVEVVYHSFELDPTAPKEAGEESMAEMLVRKKSLPTDQVDEMLKNIVSSAKQNDLTFNLDQAKIVNTFDAHRLVHFAAEHNKAAEAVEALYEAYFTNGQNVANVTTLVKLANKIGLDKESARQALESDKHTSEVKADIKQAADYGIRGVPFFIIDDKYGVSGAQGVDAFGEALSKIWHEKNPLKMMGDQAAGVCQDGLCT